MDVIKRKYNPVEPAWSSYIHIKGEKMGLPIAGNFELTSRCNFNCKMCYVHDNNNVKELSAQEWIAIGKEAVKKGMIFLLLTGGEPFLRRDFLEIYSALRNMGLLISINTNASLLTDEVISYLRKEPPLRMNISLYGWSNETYGKICGNPVFDIVVDNIKKLKQAGISVRINASITPYNCEDIEAIYRFANELETPIKATTYMFPPVRINDFSYGESKHRFSEEEAAEYMLRCRQQYMTPKQLADFYLNAVPMDEEDCTGIEGDRMRCRGGKTTFWITWDGRMLPCGMFPIEGYSLKKYDFNEAWENIREFARGLRMPKECTNCGLKEKCSVCAASCFAETGKSDIRPMYICRMTERMNELIKEKYVK